MKTEPYTEHCQLLDLLRSMIIFVFPSVVSFTTGSFKVILQETIRIRFLAQQSVATLLGHCFECLQHCSNVATLCCAKNGCCESSPVTSPLKVGN